eukprot:CAMPEP_0117684622 /NCGR_PEP_ID=MMETSP0804-20121206/21218_1 /TAXON_ID=1074897 /ORGANISM="Tetraselmis astigmatica, Strain CCMP880" /LENGTH=399 /DNA_ID=CAMNT_0005495667 /DNA_START=137 /DNA_END=1335 /DNA_ORIENTATION=-
MAEIQQEGLNPALVPEPAEAGGRARKAIRSSLRWGRGKESRIPGAKQSSIGGDAKDQVGGEAARARPGSPCNHSSSSPIRACALRNKALQPGGRQVETGSAASQQLTVQTGKLKVASTYSEAAADGAQLFENSPVGMGSPQATSVSSPLGRRFALGDATHVLNRSANNSPAASPAKAMQQQGVSEEYSPAHTPAKGSSKATLAAASSGCSGHGPRLQPLPLQRGWEAELRTVSGVEHKGPGGGPGEPLRLEAQHPLAVGSLEISVVPADRPSTPAQLKLSHSRVPGGPFTYIGQPQDFSEPQKLKTPKGQPSFHFVFPDGGDDTAVGPFLKLSFHGHIPQCRKTPRVPGNSSTPRSLAHRIQRISICCRRTAPSEQQTSPNTTAAGLVLTARGEASGER